MADAPASAHELHMHDFVHPHLIERALITTFGVELDYFKSKILGNRTFDAYQIALIDNPQGSDDIGKLWEYTRESPFFVIHPPRLAGATSQAELARVEKGSHHSKLMLLVYEEDGRRWLRIAILSANIGAYDAHSNNTIWLCDCERARGERGQRSGFASELSRYLDRVLAVPAAAKVCDALRALWALTLDEFEIRVGGAELVASVPGWHSHSYDAQFGLVRLRTCLERIPDEEAQRVTRIVIAVSSTGVLLSGTMRALLATVGRGCAQGRAALARARKKGLQARETDDEIATSVRGLVSVPWYTVEHALSTSERLNDALGAGAGGQQQTLRGMVMGCQAQKALASHLVGITPHPHRSGALNHCKMWLGLDAEDRVVWGLVGSANLSGAAMGQFEQRGLMVMNFELGVLLRASAASPDALPLPWLGPLVPYRPSDLPYSREILEWVRRGSGLGAPSARASMQGVCEWLESLEPSAHVSAASALLLRMPFGEVSQLSWVRPVRRKDDLYGSLVSRPMRVAGSASDDPSVQAKANAKSGAVLGWPDGCKTKEHGLAAMKRRPENVELKVNDDLAQEEIAASLARTGIGAATWPAAPVLVSRTTRSILVHRRLFGCVRVATASATEASSGLAAGSEWLDADLDVQPALELCAPPAGRLEAERVLVLLLPGQLLEGSASSSALVAFWSALGVCAAGFPPHFVGVWAGSCASEHGRAVALKLGCRSLPALLVVDGPVSTILARSAPELEALAATLPAWLEGAASAGHTLVELRSTRTAKEADRSAKLEAKLEAARGAGRALRLRRFDTVLIDVHDVLIPKGRTSERGFSIDSSDAAFLQQLCAADPAGAPPPRIVLLSCDKLDPKVALSMLGKLRAWLIAKCSLAQSSIEQRSFVAEPDELQGGQDVVAERARLTLTSALETLASPGAAPMFRALVIGTQSVERAVSMLSVTVDCRKLELTYDSLDWLLLRVDTSRMREIVSGVL